MNAPWKGAGSCPATSVISQAMKLISVLAPNATVVPTMLAGIARISRKNTAARFSCCGSGSARRTGYVGSSSKVKGG